MEFLVAGQHIDFARSPTFLPHARHEGLHKLVTRETIRANPGVLPMSVLCRYAFAIALAVLLVQPAEAQDAPPLLDTMAVNDDVTVGIAHFGDPHTDVLMVIDAFTLVWAQSGYILQTGDTFHTPVKTGADITGDGVPNMVVLSYSGGAHCCSTYYL